MTIETFYISNAGWNFAVLNDEGFNTRMADSYWYKTENEAIKDAKAEFPGLKVIKSDELHFWDEEDL